MDSQNTQVETRTIALGTSLRGFIARQGSTEADFAGAYPLLYAAFLVPEAPFTFSTPGAASHLVWGGAAIARTASSGEIQQLDPLRPDDGKTTRIITDDANGSCEETRRKDSMDETISELQSTQVIGKAEKTIIANVRRRLETAVDAKAACDIAATVLLDLLRKCSAMFAVLDNSSKRCLACVRRLRGILSPLSAMLDNVKCVVRNSKEWVTPNDQQEALRLMGLHLEECVRVLLSIETKSFWPEFGTGQALKKRTALFTAKCDRQRGLTSEKRRWPAAPSKTSFHGSHCKQSGSRSICSTAALSDDATDTSSSLLSLPSTPSLSPSESMLSLSSFTFPGSENITVRPSFSSRWSKTDKSSETSPPTPPSPAAEGSGLRHRKRNPPVKVSVAPGAAFIPYRSPARLAGPRGTSLRGSGAIAIRKRRFW